VVWIEHGEVVAQGTAADIVPQYEEKMKHPPVPAT
jgi:ABC-type polysaccharide/polyol phosphate transport system ATPase subunit